MNDEPEVCIQDANATCVVHTGERVTSYLSEPTVDIPFLRSALRADRAFYLRLFEFGFILVTAWLCAASTHVLSATNVIGNDRTDTTSSPFSSGIDSVSHRVTLLTGQRSLPSLLMPPIVIARRKGDICTPSFESTLVQIGGGSMGCHSVDSGLFNETSQPTAKLLLKDLSFNSILPLDPPLVSVEASLFSWNITDQLISLKSEHVGSVRVLLISAYPNDAIRVESLLASSSSPAEIRSDSIEFFTTSFPNALRIGAIVSCIFSIMFNLRAGIGLFRILVSATLMGTSVFWLVFDVLSPIRQSTLALLSAVSSSSLELYLPSLDSFMDWSRWSLFIARVELCALIACCTIPAGPGIRSIHFYSVLLFLTVSFAWIGFYSFGDVTGASFLDILLMEFSMLSSQWPGISETAGILSARPVGVIIWLTMNGTIMVCVMYSFYQALFYRIQGSAMYEQVLRMIKAGCMRRRKIDEKLRQLPKKTNFLSRNELEVIIGGIVANRLQRAGYLKFRTAITQPQELEIASKIRRDRIIETIIAVDGIFTCMSLRKMHSRSRNNSSRNRSQILLPMSDAELMHAIDSSFLQHM